MTWPASNGEPRPRHHEQVRQQKASNSYLMKEYALLNGKAKPCRQVGTLNGQN